MATKAEYGTPYRLPEYYGEEDDVAELRRYLKDLSTFRTEHFVKPGITIVNADLDAASAYNMLPDDHAVFLDLTAGIYAVALPNPEEADAAVYTIKNLTGVGTVTITTKNASLIEAVASISLATASVIPTYYSASFVCDGTDWWQVG